LLTNSHSTGSPATAITIIMVKAMSVAELTRRFHELNVSLRASST
jgi:hypothetical protein